MIHPTRTNLLLLKEKSRSVTNSIGILKARRQALIREFLANTVPFLRSRQDIQAAYANAISELRLSLGVEGEDSLESIAVATRRDLGVEISEKSVMGLKYRDVTVLHSPVRSPEERGYDYRLTTPHLDEATHLFETIVEEILEIATFTAKLKRLGEEIVRVTRRVRVLEERVLPALTLQIRTIAQYISEREREAYYRLKLFKGITSR